MRGPRPTPESRTRPCTLALYPEEIAALRACAKRRRLSVSRLVGELALSDAPWRGWKQLGLGVEPEEKP